MDVGRPAAGGRALGRRLALLVALRLGRLLDRLHARRRLAVALALALGAAVHAAATSLYSWHFIVEGSRLLWSPSGLHLYAIAPDLQMGPVTFVVGGLFSGVVPGSLGALLAAVGMLLIGYLCIERTGRLADDGDPVRRRAAILGSMAAAVIWTEVAVHYGHLDDALALAATVGAVVAASRGRTTIAVVLAAVAIDCKPWTLPLVALVVAVPRGRRLRALALLAAVVAVAWLPFAVADPQTLRIFSFAIPVAPNSSLHALGAHATTTPPWDRAVQLGGATLLVGLAAVRRRWSAVLVLLVVFRMLLDPATYHYYDSGLAVGAVWLDAAKMAARRTMRVPVLSAITAIGVTLAAYLLPAPVDTVARTAALVAILAIAVVQVLRRYDRRPLLAAGEPARRPRSAEAALSGAAA